MTTAVPSAPITPNVSFTYRAFIWHESWYVKSTLLWMQFVFLAGDNFCRVCRTNLRGVVRVRGGLYQQLARVPSPLENSSAPTQEPQPEGGSVTESDDDEQPEDLRRVAAPQPPAPRAGGNNEEPQMEGLVAAAVARVRNAARRRMHRRQPPVPQAGFLRVVPMDDLE